MRETNGVFYKVTFDQILEFEPCFDYRQHNNELLRELFGNKTELTLNEIMTLEIPFEDKLWVMDRILSEYDIAKIYVYTFAEHQLLSVEAKVLFNAMLEWVKIPTNKNRRGVQFLQDKCRCVKLDIGGFQLSILCSFDLDNCYGKLCRIYRGIRTFQSAIDEFLAEEHVDVADKILRKQA